MKHKPEFAPAVDSLPSDYNSLFRAMTLLRQARQEAWLGDILLL
jgi:hypothetical protein